MFNWLKEKVINLFTNKNYEAKYSAYIKEHEAMLDQLRRKEMNLANEALVDRFGFLNKEMQRYYLNKSKKDASYDAVVWGLKTEANMMKERLEKLDNGKPGGNETDKILQDAKDRINKILDDHYYVLIAEEDARRESPIRNWLYKSWKGFLDVFGIEKVNLKKRKFNGVYDTNEQILCFWDGSYGSGAKIMREMQAKHPLMGYARIGESRTQEALGEVAKIMRQTEIALAPLIFAAYKKLREEVIGKGFGSILESTPKPVAKAKDVPELTPAKEFKL